MTTNSRTLGVIAVFVMVIIVGVFVAQRPDHTNLPTNKIVDDEEALEVSNYPAPKTEERAVVDDGQAEPSPERAILVSYHFGDLFEDVAESEIDHQILEEYLKIRPTETYRVVRVNADLLRTKIRETADRPEMTIRLLDEEPVLLTSSYAAEHSDGWKSGIGTWRGSVADDELSRASFIIGADGSVNGEVMSVKTGRVKIETLKETSLHIIWKFGTYTGPIKSVD